MKPQPHGLGDGWTLDNKSKENVSVLGKRFSREELELLAWLRA